MDVKSELKKEQKNNLENVCKHLIDAANEKGGNDNISVILVSKD